MERLFEECGVKTCRSCGQVFSATREFWYFQKSKRVRNGSPVYVPAPSCKSCVKKFAMERHWRNRDVLLIKMRERRANNEEAYKRREKECRDKNKDERNRKQREKYAQNREERAAYERARRAANPEHFRALEKARRAANPEKYKEKSRRQAEKHRLRIAAAARAARAADPERFRSYDRKRYNLSRRIRATITSKMAKMLRENGTPKQAERKLITGWSFEELRQHLSKLFEDGMSMENWGEWQIDHIIPVSVVSFSDENDPRFKAVWSLSNLAPLWAADNNRKHNRLDWVLPSSYKNPALRDMYANPAAAYLLDEMQ